MSAAGSDPLDEPRPKEAVDEEAEGIRNLFIRRPIFAAVISIVIVLLGLFALSKLPIARYPNVTPPVVQVSANYPGATALDVATTVAAPIEQQLAGIPGLLYYKSTSSGDGSMSLQVSFDITRDQDLAAVDVQNQIALATPQLPEQVRRNGVIVQKAQPDILLVGVLTSTDPRYNGEFLSNYSKIYLEDEVKRIPGVGNATTFGNLNFAMNIELDPDKMAQLGVTVSDVTAAVNEQNNTNPAGSVGREPAPVGTQLTLPVTTLGRLSTPEEFANIIIRARPDGSVLRVSDVGTVRLGARDYGLIGMYNNKPVAPIIVYLRPGANALAVRNAYVKRMAELEKTFPAGVHHEIGFDTTPFVTTSIHEVVNTLLIAMALVTLVVFIFLQNWRSTLIPLLAVPVSIIGTFLGLWALGFTINLLTLFGLVLAIGIVVDDAIVVIENVERIMEQEKVSPRVAADKAMKQVTGALIAIVLVLCAVFIPGRARRRNHGADVQAVRGDDRAIGRDLRHRRADAHAGAVLGAAASRRSPARARPVRLVQPHLRALAQRLPRRARPHARQPEGGVRVVRRRRRARDRARARRARRIPSNGGQGLLRDRDRAAIGGVAAAHRCGRRAGAEISARAAGRVAHGRTHGAEPPAGRRGADQLRDGVRRPRAVGQAQDAGHAARCDSRERRTARSRRSRTRSSSASTSPRFPGSASPPASRWICRIAA